MNSGFLKYKYVNINYEYSSGITTVIITYKNKNRLPYPLDGFEVRYTIDGYHKDYNIDSEVLDMMNNLYMKYKLNK